MDVHGTGGEDYVDTYPCMNQLDQMWNTYCEGDYCYYINKKATNACLDAGSRDSQVYSKGCTFEQNE